MQYIVFSYNVYTLAHALYYSENEWGNDRTHIVYSNIATGIPDKIIVDYNIKFIPANDVLEKKGIDGAVCACRLSKAIWLCVKEIINHYQDEITLVVFRDNEVEEATLIDKCSKKYGKRVHYWLIEEGNGIYAVSKVPLRYKVIKSIIYKSFGVSCYSLSNNPQGLNRKIEKILCLRPDLLKTKVGKNVHTEVVKDIFQNDLNEYLVQAFSGIKKKEYKFVYLTQPLEHDTDAQSQILELILSIISEKGNVLIKPHPRDQKDYSLYVNDTIDVLAGNAKFLPFECLMNYFGCPQMISMFSSACVGKFYGKPSIYVYKLFGLQEINRIFDDEFYKENHIINCESIKQLKEVLT